MSSELEATCTRADHDGGQRSRTSGEIDPGACERAAGIFSALGDPNRLKILTMLGAGELCVSEISEALGDSLSAVSQRLKLLRSERIVKARRDGKHVYYALADRHIAELVDNALAHASET